MLHLITGKITNSPTVIMPKNDMYTPSKSNYPWWIKDADTGEIIRQYVPVSKPPKKTVDTPRHNAWYQNNAVNFKVGHIC